jgi:ATP-dependent helicase/DNAse subunit B
MGTMGLTLVTGPANSAKAAVVFERHRAALPRGAILVVPRAADVEHYRRELASEGAVLGVRVEAFGGLLREIARRAGVAGVAIGDQARERVLASVVERSSLELLAAAAAGPRFVAALAGFVAELQSRRVTPQRFTAALRAWAPEGTTRGRYGEELAALYGGYRRALERLGRLDAELLATRALDALRLAPERWGRTPVFLYGFDDLEPLQLDAIETLAERVGAAVTISLPGEPGRVALAGRAATLETLRPLAEEVIALDPVDTYYEDPTLHHLERSLFEDAPPAAAPVLAGGAEGARAVALLEGGDERAEAELVAAEIVALIAAGCAPGEIAVVTRGPASVGVLVAKLLGAWGVPCTAARRERFADTALGGGLIALLRAALLAGGAAELVRWLRVPGLVRESAFVDRFEADLLVGAIGELAGARELWERGHWPLDALARLADAAARPGPALLDRIQEELDALFSAPWRREAALLDPWPAAVLAAGRRTLRDLRELARADPSLAPPPAAIVAALERATAELPLSGEGEAVLICDALALRARRVRALFIAGLQEGAFPAVAREQAFLTAGERAELAQASGLVLGSPARLLDAERYLFYALCSRPTRWLRVSWHNATDDGEPALRSLFVDDLADCFGEQLLAARRVRGAGTLRWPAPAPPAPALAALAEVLRGPRRAGPVIGPLADPGALGLLRGHEPYSASALEKWAGCPVDWFVERGLGARPLAPDATPMLRGTAAHEALRAVLAGLRERTGSARVELSTLPVALELLDAALAATARALAPTDAVDRAERHRLHSDLARYLAFVAEAPGTFAPSEFELAFGMDDDALPAASLAGGALSLCGRIDRIDLDPAGRFALIYDYKTSSTVDAGARWAAERRLQPALYMLAVEQLFGVEAVGGLYQPLRGADLRPRGAVRDGVSPAGGLVDPDQRSAEELRVLIDAQLEAAVAAASELSAGALAPRPPSCSRDGCRHPAICRAESR